MPFGRGEGKGGFLEPAYDVLMMRGWIALQRSDGTAIELETYERFTAEALLFEWRFDSRENEDARRLWDAKWNELTFEHCDFADGRRFAVRVPKGSGRGGDWRIVVLDGARWAETQRALGETCDEVRSSLAR